MGKNSDNVRSILSGANANLWLGNELVSMLQSANAKYSGNWSEITACGDSATYMSLDGTSGTGSFKVKKISSTINAQIAENLQNGGIDTYTITSEIESPNGGTERVRLNDVTFDEVTLFDYETAKKMEDEFPFKFSSFTYIDRI